MRAMTVSSRDLCGIDNPTMRFDVAFQVLLAILRDPAHAWTAEDWEYLQRVISRDRWQTLQGKVDENDATALAEALRALIYGPTHRPSDAVCAGLQRAATALYARRTDELSAQQAALEARLVARKQSATPRAL